MSVLTAQDVQRNIQTYVDQINKRCSAGPIHLVYESDLYELWILKSFPPNGQNKRVTMFIVSRHKGLSGDNMHNYHSYVGGAGQLFEADSKDLPHHRQSSNGARPRPARDMFVASKFDKSGHCCGTYRLRDVPRNDGDIANIFQRKLMQGEVQIDWSTVPSDMADVNYNGPRPSDADMTMFVKHNSGFPAHRDAAMRNYEFPSKYRKLAASSEQYRKYCGFVQYAASRPNSTCLRCDAVVFNKNIGEGFNPKLGVWCLLCKAGVCSTCLVVDIQNSVIPRCSKCGDKFLPSRVKEVIHNADPTRLRVKLRLKQVREQYNQVSVEEFLFMLFVASGCRIIPSGSTIGLASSVEHIRAASPTWLEACAVIGSKLRWCPRCGQYAVCCGCRSVLMAVGFGAKAISQPTEETRLRLASVEHICGNVMAIVANDDDRYVDMVELANCYQFRQLSDCQLGALQAMYGVKPDDLVLPPLEAPLHALGNIRMAHVGCLAYLVSVCRLSRCTLRQLFAMHKQNVEWSDDVDNQTTRLCLQALYSHFESPLLLMEPI